MDANDKLKVELELTAATFDGGNHNDDKMARLLRDALSRITSLEEQLINDNDAFAVLLGN